MFFLFCFDVVYIGEEQVIISIFYWCYGIVFGFIDGFQFIEQIV